MAHLAHTLLGLTMSLVAIMAGIAPGDFQEQAKGAFITPWNSRTQGQARGDYIASNLNLK